MGQGRPTGAPLGAATGSIVIDTSQLATARAAVQAFATGVNTTLTGVNASSNQAAVGISQITSAARSLAGAFGFSLGVAGVAQLAKMAIGASEAATAYNRQQVAAVGLAGSQAQLNALMADYDKVTGGAIPKTEELEAVTKLLGLGFAHNVKQLDDFERAARGISLGQKLPLDDVNEKLETAIISRRRQSLRDLGLEYDKVVARAKQLENADRSLTDQQAYGTAVVNEAIAKYGKLADIPTTGIEQSKKAWADLGTEIGQVSSGPVNFIALAMTNWLKDAERDAGLVTGAIGVMGTAIRNLPKIDLGELLSQAANGGIPMPKGWNGAGAWAGGSALGGGGGGGGKGGFGGPPDPSDEEIAIDSAWNERKKKINADAQDAINAEDKQAGAQRAEIVSNNNKQITREAEDFARQRVGEERKLGLDILDVAQASSRQRVKWEEALSRSIAQAQADSTDHVAGLRKDANKQLAELDQNYEKERLKRAKDLSDSLLDAAGNLDAKQVYELQRNAAEQEEAAKSAHDDARKTIQDQLQERLDDEAKSLAKSITQQREALAQREADQAADDAQRVTDLKASFEAQKTEEDIERGTRLKRQQDDFNDQLNAFDAAHNDRIDQIHKHAAAEKTANDDEWKKQLHAISVEVDGYATELKRITDEAIKQARRYIHEGFGIGPDVSSPTVPGNTPHGVPALAAGGAVARTGLAMVHGGEFMLSRAMLAGNQPIPIPVRNAVAGNGGADRSIHIGTMPITINGAPTDSPADFAYKVREEIYKTFIELADEP